MDRRPVNTAEIDLKDSARERGLGTFPDLAWRLRARLNAVAAFGGYDVPLSRNN